jgi:hypothetical protein
MEKSLVIGAGIIAASLVASSLVYVKVSKDSKSLGKKMESDRVRSQRLVNETSNLHRDEINAKIEEIAPGFYAVLKGGK